MNLINKMHKQNENSIDNISKSQMGGRYKQSDKTIQVDFEKIELSSVNKTEVSAFNNPQQENNPIEFEEIHS